MPPSHFGTSISSSDFIVLLESDGSIADYLKQWLEKGIPDAAATLVYRDSDALHGAVAIYEWRS